MNHPFSFQSPQKSNLRYDNRINGYDVKEEIGKGGFGVVYRAISLNKSTSGKNVAIKMVDILTD